MIINNETILLEPQVNPFEKPAQPTQPHLTNYMQAPFTERYRPETLNDLCGSDNLRALKAFVKTAKFPLAMIFHGDYGNGKTSAARALVRDYFVQSGLFNPNATFKDIRNGVNTTPKYQGLFPPVLYVDATLTRDIEFVKETVQQFMKTVSAKGTKKFVIIDEADRLSHDAQGALRSLLEKYPNTVTIYTTNSLHVIDKAIVSRAAGAVIEFEKPNNTEISAYLQRITTRENMYLSSEILDHIAEDSENLREAIGKLGTELTIMESATE